MIYTAENIAEILNAALVKRNDTRVERLLLDSRRVYAPEVSVFFALKGMRRDGMQFIPELYEKGVRNFVIADKIDITAYPEANFIYVTDTLLALQQLAAFHRKQFSIPVIGITGSNGKTIVKEWLFQLLQEDHNIVRSPKSYNSQIGVPLSVWEMNKEHTLGIFEAGISRPGEMEKLAKIIQPGLGVLTNIGEAHSEGFSSKAEKEKEKRILFKNAKQPGKIEVLEKKQHQAGTTIIAKDPQSGRTETIDIPFTDDASIQNAVTCWEVLLSMGYQNDIIRQRMKNLLPVHMRLELKKGIHGCSVINDSYSTDISSLEIALHFLEQQSAGSKKTVILSDFFQSNHSPKQLIEIVIRELKKYRINRFIGIGEQMVMQLAGTREPDLQVETFLSTEDFLKQFRFSTFKDEFILVKGARVFAFERIVQVLEQKVHQTVLEINLSAIIHNLKAYQQLLQPSTKVMAMVKAFAYGSGGVEIAGILQFHKVDYLGVAYTDEGVDLRKAGIHLPIMVMNPEVSAFEAIIENNLEPELYSFELFRSFDAFLQKENIRQYPVHLEIETGMNRLGFLPSGAEQLAAEINATSSFSVKSVFSHLAAGEDPQQDEFTFQQFQQFDIAVEKLRQRLGYTFLRHLANSAAIIRHPQLQMDMVRLGIGMYGVDSAATGKLSLQTVATLKSTIAQVKHLKKGESVSYNRISIVTRDTTTATIRLGYADGYPRRLGNGAGKIFIKGNLVPVIGTVCMDMFMVDITGIPGIQEGDEVIIFGEQLPVQQLAKWAGTIPYEIMTGISQRVNRVYFQE